MPDSLVSRITRIEPFGEEELLARFKQTRLRGHGQPLVYAQARLELVRNVDPHTLYPAQNYVLQADHLRLHALHAAFLQHGHNIFALEGGLFFWVRTGEEEEGPIPLTPPLVEISQEADGRVLPLINDGMHRVYTAMRLHQPIHIVLADNVPAEWPYYAHPLANGWADVEEMAELPENHVKKSYRNPKNYKDLFRDFNAVFPGIQKQRTRGSLT